MAIPEQPREVDAAMNIGQRVVPRDPAKNEGQEASRTDDGRTRISHLEEEACKVMADEATETSPSDGSSVDSETSIDKTTRMHGGPSSTMSSSMPKTSSKYPTIELQHRRRPGHRYRPAHQTKYLNNLMPIVGFLELTNALDFPANVWNQTPVPAFAKGLMITGGSVAILASFLAFRDLYKSVTNFRLLKKERIHLLKERKVYEQAGDDQKANMMQAWLDVNFREALWEAAERMLMDSLNGFAGIIVGIGTILAVDGANPTSYDASNLLSGYVGNSFNVVYGAANTAFAIYMFNRSRKHSRKMKQALPAGALQRRVLGYMKRHQVYAVVNGITVFVSAIGSMISAKNWEGYAVLIPCVIGAIFCNFYWRHLVGYDRDFCQWRPDAAVLDARERLQFSIDAMELIKSHEGDRLLAKKTGAEVTQFMAQHGMLEVFTARVLHELGDQRQSIINEQRKRHVDVTIDRLSSVDEDILVKSASTALRNIGYHRFRDQERMLAELWGAQLAQQTSPGASTAAEEKPSHEQG